MRTAFVYGALLGAFQFAATLVIHACGLHSAADKIESGHRVENLVAFVLMMTCLSLGLRAIRRQRHAEGEPFGFLVGVKKALLIATVGGLVNALGQYFYVAAIHPGYSESFRGALVASAGFTADQAAEYASQIDFLVSPSFRALNQGLTTFLFGLLIGVAYSALFRDRPAPAAATNVP